jgi:hypothetical protein
MDNASCDQQGFNLNGKGIIEIPPFAEMAMAVAWRRPIFRVDIYYLLNWLALDQAVQSLYYALDFGTAH